MLVFLDMDGVLNHHKTKREQNKPLLDTECIQRFNVCFRNIHDLKIILSSSWRNDCDLLCNQTWLHNKGFAFDFLDQTPYFPGANFHRELEIRLWVKAAIDLGFINPEVEAILIIDDCIQKHGFFSERVKPYSLETDEYNGGFIYDTLCVEPRSILDFHKDTDLFLKEYGEGWELTRGYIQPVEKQIEGLMLKLNKEPFDF
jgi:hypothetical protein